MFSLARGVLQACSTRYKLVVQDSEFGGRPAPGAQHCGAHFAFGLGSFKNCTDGKWPRSEFLLDFKSESSEVGTLIWGHFSVPVYNLLEHSLS